ncbi:fimbrial protein [Cupriavidus basilensis]|uniref:Fimbrial protein n=1 Tax=Cupriavidus basilensis TaxID=68895 RepID=A0ABT6AL55_9BURK|nr:fimbrial protein [Cupriavidus basilensis]MDF3833199.1 fimbrial protein [Cupriavidus basilensis]
MMVPSLSREQRTDGRRIRQSVICLKTAILLWLATVCSSAFARVECSVNYSDLNFSLPTGTYTIPRGAPTGTRITPFTRLQQTYQNVWNCNDTADIAFGPALQSTLTFSGTTYWENGLSYQVFNTNLDGVGLIMQSVGYMERAGWSQTRGLDTTSWLGMASARYSPPPGPLLNSGVGMAFAFVKTGPITPGMVVLGVIAQAGMAEFPSGTPNGPVSSVTYQLPVTAFTGNSIFIVPACTTPSIPVDLRSHRSSEFSGPNTVTSSVNFDLALNNCPAGMKAIQYQVDAVTPIISSVNSVVALDGTSTATGVGVQLLDGSGAAFQLGRAQTFNGYNSTTGGSYTIPFRARYIQTGSTVGPGRANSVMTFTMTYQ